MDFQPMGPSQLRNGCYRQSKLSSRRVKGKGNALKAGFAACTGDIIVMLDADGSADPNEIPLLLQHCWQGMILLKDRVL